MNKESNAPLRESKIIDFNELEEIINKSVVCHIGFVDDDKPYVLPFNFGYTDKSVFIHSATTGRKTEIITKNNNVCLNFNIDNLLFFRDKEVACSYGMRFKSVMIFGKINLVEDYDDKINAMSLIMKKYTGESFKFNAPAINNVNVYEIKIEEITGKKYGY